MRNQTIFLGIVLLASSFLSSCDTNKNATTDTTVNAPMNQNEMPANQATDSLMKTSELPLADSLQNNEASEKSDKDKD